MVISCMKIEAEIYGMIPSASMDALEKLPPAKVSNNPSKPSFAPDKSNLFGSIPGSTMCAPNLYTRIRSKVILILLLNSSILQIFLSVLISLFTTIVFEGDSVKKETPKGLLSNIGNFISRFQVCHPQTQWLLLLSHWRR